MLLVASESFLHRNADVIGLTGVAVGVVAIMVAVFIYQRQKSPKRLDWQPLGSNPLVSLPAPYVGPLIEVTANGEPLESPFIVRLRIANSGKIAIGAGDFEQPLTFIFPRSEIKNFSVLNYSHVGMSMFKIEQINKRQAHIVPSSLNRGEGFEIQFMVEGEGEYPKVEARVFDEQRPIRRVEVADSLRGQIAVKVGSRDFGVTADLLVLVAFVFFMGSLLSTAISRWLA